MHVYIHIYVYMNIYIHIYKCIYAYIYVHKYTCTYIHIYIYTYVYVCIYTYIHTSIFIYLCIHICMYLYVFIGIYIRICLYIYIYMCVCVYMCILISLSIYKHIYTYLYTYIQAYLDVTARVHDMLKTMSSAIMASGDDAEALQPPWPCAESSNSAVYGHHLLDAHREADLMLLLGASICHEARSAVTRQTNFTCSGAYIFMCMPLYWVPLHRAPPLHTGCHFTGVLDWFEVDVSARPAFCVISIFIIS